MRRRLGRFVTVGSVVTAIDLIVLVVLREGIGMPLVIADLISILAAANVSYRLNRRITLYSDPYARWMTRPAAYGATVAIGALVDIVVLVALLAPDTASGVGPLVVAKLAAVGAAMLVRLAIYRLLLFRVIRHDQDRRVERPPAPGDVRLSVVVPAYGEESGIAATIAALREGLEPAVARADLEIVVVDDGSPDRTAAAAEAGGADRVVRLPENRGKGGAVRAGVLVAQGRTIAFTDADLAYSPDQLVGLLEMVEDGWDAVVGSRMHTQATTLVRARRMREVGGRVINVFTQVVLLGQYRDTQCGLKAFRSDVARLIFGHARIDGFAFDVEVLHLIESYRLSLTEVPVHVRNSDTSTVRVVRDAMRLIRDLFRIRAWSRQGDYRLTQDERAVLAARVGSLND